MIAGWAAGARAALESAYLGRLTELGHADLLDRSLLRPFEIEQECRELIYAAGHLPLLALRPMGVLRSCTGDLTSVVIPVDSTLVVAPVDPMLVVAPVTRR